jgi:hypothetical protein
MPPGLHTLSAKVLAMGPQSRAMRAPGVFHRIPMRIQPGPHPVGSLSGGVRTGTRTPLTQHANSDAWHTAVQKCRIDSEVAFNCVRAYTRSPPRSIDIVPLPLAFVWRGPRLRTYVRRPHTRSKPPQITIQNCSECCNKSKSRADPKHTSCVRVNRDDASSRNTSQSGRYVWNMLAQHAANQAGS